MCWREPAPGKQMRLHRISVWLRKTKWGMEAWIWRRHPRQCCLMWTTVKCCIPKCTWKIISGQPYQSDDCTGGSENASLDTVLTATDSVKINESGAQLCGLKSGDTMTLDQALHILLMYSANDAAMLIAENVGGSVDHLWNDERRGYAAWGDQHQLCQSPWTFGWQSFTTAYDLYLIFNEAIKYDSFNEIIHMTSYQTTFYDKDGKAKELTVNNTNRFLKGDFNAPEILPSSAVNRYDQCGRTLPDSAVQRCERRTVYIRYIEFIGQRCPISWDGTIAGANQQIDVVFKGI